MLSLRLFGGATLEGPSGVLTGRASQRHRLALLALLATAGNGGVSRDKLLSYLWPEADLERGRHLLSNSLYVLRSALGEDALPGTADMVRLCRGRVNCDVRQFEEAVRRGDLERAVKLYTGPFLDGFHISGLPEFEHWMDRERSRLAAARDRSLEALAELAEGRGSHHDAVRWWKERAASDPLDSRVAMKLMRALNASGNRAGALRHGVIYQRLLHEELGSSPAGEFTSLMERLRHDPEAGDSGAAVPVVVEVAPPASRTPPDAALMPATLSPSPAVPLAPLPTAASNGLRHRGAWAIVLVIAALASVAGFLTRVSDKPGLPPPARSIVVLPFVNITAAEENERFSDGLTEEIITRLATVDELKVISRTSAMHYKGSTLSLREIAGELDVGHVMEGSVREGAEGLLRVTAQLIDARTDALRWVESFDVARDDDLFDMQTMIAMEVVRALEAELAEPLALRQ